MRDFEIVLAEVLKILNKEFSVFGFNLNIMAVFIGVFILGLVLTAARKLMK